MSIKNVLALATALAGFSAALPSSKAPKTGTHISKRQNEWCPGAGTPCWGDITWFDTSVGPGSCGWQNSNSDWVVALPVDMMDAQGVSNPNDNPLCGKTITINYNGQTAQATVVDTCEGCVGESIDLTEGFFTYFGSDGTGRISGVEWYFDN